MHVFELRHGEAPLPALVQQELIAECQRSQCCKQDRVGKIVETVREVTAWSFEVVELVLLLSVLEFLGSGNLSHLFDRFHQGQRAPELRFDDNVIKVLDI